MKYLDWQEPHLIFAHFAQEKGALFFDSARNDTAAGRYSYICVRPQHCLTLQKNAIYLDGKLLPETDIFSALEKYSDTLFTQSEYESFFTGGWAGYLGYEVGHQIEKLPEMSRDFDYADMSLGFYQTVFVFDHDDKTLRLYGETKEIEQSLKTPLKIENFTKMPIDWRSNFTPKNYAAAVANVIDYIQAGDIYQANLSQRMSAQCLANFQSYAHYCHLRNISPAPFACYQNWGDMTIASNSPERFIKLQNNHIETKPIKGTAPRCADIDEDRKIAENLQNSAKNIAENLMIVDLLRNDIGRVCKAGTVEVHELFKLESYSNVHHLVSTITGKLAADKTVFDVLKATFPGGSITGAPKIRAMEIISELEQSARGVYCGSAVLIGRNYMDSNILIRTLVYHQDKITFNVGGGIVADSKPDDEYQETLHKARSLLNSFETEPPK